MRKKRPRKESNVSTWLVSGCQVEGAVIHTEGQEHRWWGVMVWPERQGIMKDSVGSEPLWWRWWAHRFTPSPGTFAGFPFSLEWNPVSLSWPIKPYMTQVLATLDLIFCESLPLSVPVTLVTLLCLKLPPVPEPVHSRLPSPLIGSAAGSPLDLDCCSNTTTSFRFTFTILHRRPCNSQSPYLVFCRSI